MVGVHMYVFTHVGGESTEAMMKYESDVGHQRRLALKGNVDPEPEKQTCHGAS